MSSNLHIPGRGPGAALLAALAFLLPGSAVCVADDQVGFEVRSAMVELRDGVYYLDADIRYGLTDTAYEALQNGIVLTFELQIDVDRVRRWLPDRGMASLRQRYTLEFHALTRRYVVRNVNGGEQASFATLAAAADSLGRVSGIPVIDAALLKPSRRYEVSLRAVLDIRRLPLPLRVFGPLFGDWRLTSDWYRWRFRHEA